MDCSPPGCSVAHQALLPLCLFPGKNSVVRRMSQSSVIPALQGTQEGEEYLLSPVALRLQSLLVVSTEEFRMRKKKHRILAPG